MHFKCIIFVISSKGCPYDQFKELWLQHWRANQQYLSGYALYFLYNEPCSESVEPEQSRSDLCFPHEETYPNPGLLLKTMDALQYLAETGVTFDVLCRTNLSSMYNWRVFVQFVKAIHSPFYGGRKYANQHVSGCAMFMTGDIAALLLERRTSLSLDVPDDESINKFLHANGPKRQYPDITSATPTNSNEITQALSDQILHFRFYQANQNRCRSADVEMMRLFCKLYNLDNTIHRRHNAVVYLLLLCLFICSAFVCINAR